MTEEPAQEESEEEEPEEEEPTVLTQLLRKTRRKKGID